MPKFRNHQRSHAGLREGYETYSVFPQSEIANVLERSPSTISRELTRNRGGRGYGGLQNPSLIASIAGHRRNIFQASLSPVSGYQVQALCAAAHCIRDQAAVERCQFAAVRTGQCEQVAIRYL